jgi:hypothetical protein
MQSLTVAKHPSYTSSLHCSLPASLWRVEIKGDWAMSTTVQNEKTQGKRRSRPLTARQERLFFGALFAIAALVQVSVVWAQIIR